MHKVTKDNDTGVVKVTKGGRDLLVADYALLSSFVDILTREGRVTVGSGPMVDVLSRRLSECLTGLQDLIVTKFPIEEDK